MEGRFQTDQPDPSLAVPQPLCPGAMFETHRTATPGTWKPQQCCVMGWCLLFLLLPYTCSLFADWVL